MNQQPVIAVLVGNPRAGSRTSRVAREVADQVADTIGGTVDYVIELAEYGPQVLDPDASVVTSEVEKLAGVDVLVVASPTYKATYTGLLKGFLDRYNNDGLAGVVAIPVLLGASASHALAGEVHLRPLLVELGCVVPARSLYVIDSCLDELPTTVGVWLDGCEQAVRAAVGQPIWPEVD